MVAASSEQTDTSAVYEAIAARYSQSSPDTRSVCPTFAVSRPNGDRVGMREDDGRAPRPEVRPHGQQAESRAVEPRHVAEFVRQVLQRLEARACRVDHEQRHQIERPDREHEEPEPEQQTIADEET